MMILIRRLLGALWLLSLLTACQIEGGVRDRTPVVANTNNTTLQVPTNQAVAQALAQ